MPDTTSLPILILAAGASSRMRGRDKLMEEIDGEPLLRRSTNSAIATGHPVWVALPPEPHPRYALLADLPVTTVEVKAAADGLNASLRAGLAPLRQANAVMILLADLPDITTAHLNAIFAARLKDPKAQAWRGATEDGKPGHPTLIDQSLLPEIMALTGDQGAQPVLKTARTIQVPLPGRAARMDLDTPEDWAEWKANRGDDAPSS